MVKVIKSGKASMSFICKTCDCEFRASVKDLTLSRMDGKVLGNNLKASIDCPECGAKCICLAPHIFIDEKFLNIGKEVTSGELNDPNR